VRAALVGLLEGGSGEAQRAAAFALGLLGPRGAERELLRAVFLKRDAVREAALFALSGATVAPAALDPEIEVPDGKPDARGYVARLAAIDPAAARRIRPGAPELPREALPAVREALGRHRDLVLRTLLDLDAEDDALALGPLGAPPDAAGLLAPLAAELEPLAGHADPAIRLHTLRLLAKLGAPATEAALARALGERDPDLARSAAAAARLYVGRAPGRAAPLAALLTEHLRATGWSERAAAARALGADSRLGTLALGPLAAAASDESGFVREEAALALGTTRDRRARPALERLRQDAAPSVREAAQRALRNLP
jgi:HEAT repeat protein